MKTYYEVMIQDRRGRWHSYSTHPTKDEAAAAERWAKSVDGYQVAVVYRRRWKEGAVAAP